MANITKHEPRSMTPSLENSPFSLIDRLFDDSFDPFSMLAPSIRKVGMSSFPKVDVTETESAITVTANVPGVDPDKIDIEVGQDYLSLSGRIEKEESDKDASGKVYRYEREYGEFRREFTLPARVEKDGIKATAKNGVLTITLPKSEEERKTRVKVEVA